MGKRGVLIDGLPWSTESYLLLMLFILWLESWQVQALFWRKWFQVAYLHPETAHSSKSVCGSWEFETYICLMQVYTLETHTPWGKLRFRRSPPRPATDEWEIVSRPSCEPPASWNSNSTPRRVIAFALDSKYRNPAGCVPDFGVAFSGYFLHERPSLASYGNSYIWPSAMRLWDGAHGET